MIGSLVVLVPLAALMAYVTAVLVRWAAEARTAMQAAVVLFLFLMMAAMFAGAAVYFVAPSAATLVEGLWLSAATMSLSVIPLFLTFLRDARREELEGPDAAPPAWAPGPAFTLTIVGLVLLNELLMGGTFTAASGTSLGTSGSGVAALGSTLSGVIVSPWFLFTMSAEMALTTYFLRDRLPRSVSVVLALQSAIMLCSPPALAAGNWPALSLYAGSGAMVVLFVYLMELLYRRRELALGFSGYVARLLPIYAVMMAGLYVWLVAGSPVLFAASVVAEMVVFFEAVLRPGRFAEGRSVAWQLRPHWTFGVLATIFVAELWMGALLDLSLEPAVYSGIFGALPLAGTPLTVLGNAVSNGFWFIALTTGSTWFLAMMGLEMGALVVFKLKETKRTETRIQLGLLMGCYGAFAVFFPSVYYAALFPNWPAGTSVPVLGWSMGIGSLPLGPTVFGVLALSYAITGALCVLFGRRVICSVFCTAPLMYQGTAIDAMSSFNRTSPVGRKYLGSRFSRLYSWTSGGVMAGLVGASFLSYLDQTGRLDVTVGGTDPTVFLFALSFGVLWYVLFVTIPYVGNYNCVTMGWCYTGTIAQAFGRIGFFRLKVRDRSVCRTCRTLDCAKVCPVGLVDMPGHFRTKGEFRSSKCCGVGNCVGACPYGNLYMADVRHWLRDRIARSRGPALGTPLPMVRRTSTRAGTPGAPSARSATPSGSLPSGP